MPARCPECGCKTDKIFDGWACKNECCNWKLYDPPSESLDKIMSKPKK